MVEGRCPRARAGSTCVMSRSDIIIDIVMHRPHANHSQAFVPLTHR